MKNLAIISLINNASEIICQKFCQKTNKLYSNVDELFEFNMGDLEKALQVGGIDFFDKEQYENLKNVIGFENALLTMSYNTFSKKQNFQLLKDKCFVIFLKFDLKAYDKYNKNIDKSEFELNKVVFFDRQNVFMSKCHLIVDASNLSEKEIVNKLIRECKAQGVL